MQQHPDGSAVDEKHAITGRRPLLPTLAIICMVGLAQPALADPGDALDTGGGGAARSYVRHANELLNQGQITDAIALCNKALAIYPNYIRARYTRGRANLAAGENEAAIADFTQVIAAHPEYPLVYQWRADAELRARKPQAAIADLNQALTAEVGMRSQLAARVFMYRSLAWEMLGQNRSAVDDFTNALRPLTGHLDDYTMLNAGCYSAAIVGLLATALDTCNESINRQARNEDVYDSRGLVYLKQGAWDKAIADYTRSLYYRPNMPESLYGRGLAKQARGDAAGAAADIAAAREVEPNITQIMARLGVKAAAPDRMRANRPP